MKRLYLLILLVFLTPHKSYSFDISGLQPTAPNGVFSTFSAESLAKSRSAFEMAFERSNQPNFYRFSLRGAYGISDSLEFNFNVPYVYRFEDSQDGFEDISIGFKHRFYDEGKYGPSLAYLVNASINNGRDVFTTNGRFGLGFIISKRVGPFKGHFNLFFERPGTGRLKDEISILGGIEFAAAHNFTVLGELFTKKSHFSNEYDQVEARLGYRLKTTDYIYTTLGAGLDLKRRSPELRVLFSVSFMSPQKKKEIEKIYEKEE